MAKSGGEALDCLGREIPDLVLLDIHMQDMDGYEVMQRMKENHNTADVPVILLTADDGERNKERGIMLGAVDFIGKPFEPQVLLERIEAVLKTEE